MRILIAMVAALSLVAGFAIALLTGIRLAGAWRTAVVGLVYVGDPCRVRDRRGGLSDCAEGGVEELSDSSPRRT